MVGFGGPFAFVGGETEPVQQAKEHVFDQERFTGESLLHLVVAAGPQACLGRPLHRRGGCGKPTGCLGEDARFDGGHFPLVIGAAPIVAEVIAVCVEGLGGGTRWPRALPSCSHPCHPGVCRPNAVTKAASLSSTSAASTGAAVLSRTVARKSAGRLSRPA
jgi:hypothetical protein